MARRFYLAAIDGDGASPATAWRMRGGRTAGFWPRNTKAVIDRAGAKYVFAEADTTDAEHAAITADAGIYHVPVPASLDSAMTANQRNAAEAKVLSLFDEVVNIPNGTTWRQFLRGLLRRILPSGEIA